MTTDSGRELTGERESGYFLAEVLVLSLLLAALAGGLLVYAQARTASSRDGCRMQAAYLAQLQIAAAERRMDREHKLEGKSLPWLGKADDLTLDGNLFQVDSELAPCPEGALLCVTVSWEQTGKKQQLQLERVIARHGTAK